MIDEKKLAKLREYWETRSMWKDDERLDILDTIAALWKLRKKMVSACGRYRDGKMTANEALCEIARADCDFQRLAALDDGKEKGK